MLRKVHPPVLMERIARRGAANHLPSARVGIYQRVVQAVGIAVEVLRVVGALHVGIYREERRHLRVVHAAVHVDQAKGVKVLMPSETPVKHRIGQLA